MVYLDNGGTLKHAQQIAAHESADYVCSSSHRFKEGFQRNT